MRRNSFRCRWLLELMIAISIAATPARAAAPLVNATIEPSQIAMGDSAELTITSTGTGMDAVDLPQVDGLEFRVVGRSRRIEIVNGATLSTSSIVVRVTPQAAGIYTIPGITPKSQPLVLRVNPDNGSAGTSPGNPAALPKLGGGSGSEGIRLTADGSAFVRLVLPKHEIYVGESIPVEIEVGMRSGFVTSLNGLPTLTGGDFTLNNLSHQPERLEKLIDGKPFTLLTWHSIIAAVKPGNFSLSVESPLTVRIRTRPPRDSMLDDMLGDPFFQNFFGATVPKDITVASPPADLTVSALPTEGRPPAFSGAVGTFKIASDVSSSTAVAGDPLTLRMRVTGAGNFDRVDSSMLEHLDQWKTYPPKSSFKPGDAVGFKGEKIFEQPVIGSKPGVQSLPGLAFSYFDPVTKRYETARSAPLEVTIAPSLADSSAKASQPAATDAATGQSRASAAHPGLRPDHVVTQAKDVSLVPLYLEPRFLMVPSFLALAFAGGWLALRRGSDPAERRTRRRRGARAADAALKELEAAAQSGNGARFFSVARTALLKCLAARWQLAPDRITPAVLEARLGEDGAAIRNVLALADEANYSGEQPSSRDFDRWLAIVRHQLEDEPC